MMIETPAAFGLTMVVCLSLFFYCWYVRKLRYRLTSVQVSATPNEVQEHTGMKKEVVDTFPTVRSYELKVDIKDELQCPICLVEYGNTEVLRKLPYCAHVFHINCVDFWLQEHVTCPVCRIVLTEYNPKPETLNHQTTNCRVFPSAPNSGTVEISPATPAWVLVNRPLPLPPSTPRSSSHQTLQTPETLNSSESRNVDVEHQRPENSAMPCESPLLRLPSAPRWKTVYLQHSAQAPVEFSFRSREADIAMIDSNGCVAHAPISDGWVTESFSFEISTSEERVSSVGWFGSTEDIHEEQESSVGLDSSDEVAGVFRGWRRRVSRRSKAVTKSWDFERSSDEEVGESEVGSPVPLTVSPEHCSFEFLPIVTGPGGDYSLTNFHR